MFLFWIQFRLFVQLTITKVATTLLGCLPATILVYSAYNFLVVPNFPGWHLVLAPFLGVYGIVLLFEVLISWIKNIE